MSTTSSALVEINDNPLPPEVVPLLTSAYVDDSQRLPDMFSLRFRDPGRVVLSKTDAKVGAKLKVSVMVAEAAAPEPLTMRNTALETIRTGGTLRVRGYDQAHRLSGRRTPVRADEASDTPKVAQRAGLAVGT